MSDREIIARCNCPICGAENQDVKINKRENLYMFCDNRCMFRFSRPESRRLTDELRAGHVVKSNNMILRPVNFNKQPTTKEVMNHEPARIEPRRDSTIGRTDRQPATVAGNAGANYKPSGLAEWLFGDDDD